MPAWWSEERINATVQRDYVRREIGSKRLQDQLSRPLGFGQGLTDDTYLDWIVHKGKRLFLILDHIGTPEWIFHVLDKSLDDEDLPLSEDALWDLNLFGGKSETLDKKFFKAQFKFLVRTLEPGDHVDYKDDEAVPLESVSKRTNSSESHNGDKVYVRERIYTRKKISTSGETGIDRAHFVIHVKALHAIRHPHIVTLWASYTQNDFSYMLLTPCTDVTLKSFLDEPPKSFKQLEKPQRQELLLKWTHCLASALAYLHSNDLTHQTIRPSSVSISNDNTIYLFDFAAHRALDSGDSSASYKSEIYEHAAPENWQRKTCLHETAPLKTLLPGGGRTARRIPKTPGTTPRSNMTSPSSDNRRNRSTTESSSSSGHSRSRNTRITTFAPPSLIGNPSFPGDVFSLTAILLHLLSFLLGHSPKASSSHRSRHNRTAGRGGAPADASFHKNLPQVGTWIEKLQDEAKEKERVFRKAKFKGSGESAYWGAVFGALGICKEGLRKDTADRISARHLEKQIRKWADRGLGTGRRWCCGGETEEVIPGMSFASVAGADCEFEAKSVSREKSLRTVSMASWEGQLPIQRPISLADTLSVDGSTFVNAKVDEFKKESNLNDYEFYIPEESEDDWPIRTEFKTLPTRPKPLSTDFNREFKRRDDYRLRRGAYVV